MTKTERTQQRPLAERLRECADEVARFPHPSQCDHLHDAAATMREAAVEIETPYKAADDIVLLRDALQQLATALDNAFICDLQSTAAWQGQLEHALRLLAELDEDQP